MIVGALIYQIFPTVVKNKRKKENFITDKVGVILVLRQ